MNKDEFYGALSELDEDALRKALWTLYWRGSAQVRERIEDEIRPADTRPSTPRKEQADPQKVLRDVTEFASLAQAGAYLAGDRRVSPKARTRWRFTFQGLAKDAMTALVLDVPAGAAAIERLVDLACETKSYDLFRSEDPMEAANFVVSDAVAALWRALLDHHGFDGFARSAAPQLVRWEREFGWTRSGWGRVSEKETTLATVLTRMLRGADAWSDFAGHYLTALDAARNDGPDVYGIGPGHFREERTGDLAQWHLLLLEHLDGDADGLLDRLVTHRELAGPELTHLQARRALQTGDPERARVLMRSCLKELPGHKGFLSFAEQLAQ
ncbi:hypothetical protein [Actinomadura algeriensis]|uniref:CARD domain-containing protein n=1 Tax=Actinomadura algeriensis TaxID=1679523 RepID=A0ABR9JK18_9ACTN|nr:hypothetical protein [Actinomadura algeriensis]MBE1530882.1 hypothetical protein [Actinomadura algeriensis]